MPVEGGSFVSHTYLRQSPEAEWRRIGEDQWARSDPGTNREQLMGAMGTLSATTAPGGGGPDAYAALLAEDFTRWTAGDSTAMDRAAWLEGVRGWWDKGWRVADRQVQALDVDVRGRHAFVRRVVQEEYAGPDSERTDPGTPVALSEVWERQGHRWLLLRVVAFPVDGD